ncbi:tRNA-dependent lipid II-Ala--L-alanine ligase [Streptococcus oralis]|uniref:tRNA-dependent lipid II-Ala--L-alanine ligase n=1 Tax=Streptococcus oralis TaxID=1303 RepID=A0A139RE20_STROR|nr:peptidoglycan bridge formation glycyltransferase FemA/FemB family protein [Streptococcus oralis]KXU12993.1 tRNA-dependent lipid II-Ala--L-alanine ligase [Streptococcus oralis]
MTFVVLSIEEFNQHTHQSNHCSFMQSAEMEVLLRNRGYTTHYLGWKEEKQVLVSALLYSIPMTGGLHMEINSGPVCTDEKKLSDFYKALQTYAKENGALELVIKPDTIYQTFDNEGQPTSKENDQLIKELTDLGYVHDGFTTSYSECNPNWNYIKDLTPYNKDSLLNSFNKNSIRNIKKSLKYKIIIRRIESDELVAFKQITNETAKRQGFKDKSLDYYQAVYHAFGDKADFIIAELDIVNTIQHIEKEAENLDKSSKNYPKQFEQLQEQKEKLKAIADNICSNKLILACALILYTSQEATYLFGGSLKEYQQFSAPFLIQYHAMVQSMEKKIPKYNFYGISGNFDGNDGVLRFKQNFNGYIIRKVGVFRYYPNPRKIKFLHCIKKIFKHIRLRR